MDSHQLKNNLYIDGQWINGSEAQRIPVYNPANGTEITSVADATLADAKLAIDAAHKAAAPWANLAPRERAEILRQCWELMTRNKTKIAKMISAENGKSHSDAMGEAGYAAEFFRWFAEEAVRERGNLSTAPSGANRILVTHRPIGISLLITPWNFPAAMATRKIAPALAAGCTCILKPATETPLTAYLIAELLAEAGVPKGVVNVLTASNTSQLVNSILDDQRVRKVSFTGSTQVGSILLKKAAERVVSPSMELGGNAPFIVFEDADVDKAVDGLMLAKMRNGGSACTAANRIYVHRSLAETFIPQFTARMQALKMGDASCDETVDLGALVNKTTADKVAQLVDDALAKGAKALCGGKQPGDKALACFYPPTVLVDIPEDAKLVHTEIFGPVAPMYLFDEESEVIKRANDTPYGLIAYVYTENLARGLRVCEQLEAGMLALNRGIASDPAAPFGGFKESGLGREGADHGMLEFMEVQYIATQW